MMKIFNTYSQKHQLINLKTPLGIYVCGITPYDTTHLGHAFTFIAYDVLIRYLRFLEANVTYVQNVTDIDDDILIKSKSLGISWKKLGEAETKKHLQTMDKLNALRPDFFPLASENIKDMIAIIKVLISKKLAYVTNGSVYFHVKSDKNFGSLSKLDYKAMLELANERGNYPLDPNKTDPLDFVLWQSQKPAEPVWDSPWGKGRPGWHIECSAMSLKYLGKSVTIHGGGEDLIFPHHESEIAQSENYTGKKFVNVWMHAAMVYCGEHKMSKSLGNMIFIYDLLQRYSPNAIRILLLSHHYRKPWNYNEKELKESVKKAAYIENFTLQPSARQSMNKRRIPSAFINALDEDLHTPKALGVLLNLIRSRNITPSIAAECGNILGLMFKN